MFTMKTTNYLVFFRVGTARKLSSRERASPFLPRRWGSSDFLACLAFVERFESSTLCPVSQVSMNKKSVSTYVNLYSSFPATAQGFWCLSLEMTQLTKGGVGWGAGTAPLN